MSALLPVPEAQARLLALAPRVEAIEEIALASAIGRWAAAPVHALTDHPFADL